MASECRFALQPLCSTPMHHPEQRDRAGQLPINTLVTCKGPTNHIILDDL